MQSTPSLPLLPSLLCPGVVAPIYRSNRSKLGAYTKLNCLQYDCFDIDTAGLC